MKFYLVMILVTLSLPLVVYSNAEKLIQRGWPENNLIFYSKNKFNDTFPKRDTFGQGVEKGKYQSK